MRIVVKVGTNILIDKQGKISSQRIEHVGKEIASLIKGGHEVVLVSSGAIAAGRSIAPKLSISQNKQVWAAVGQPALMQLYISHFKKFGIKVGQCLLLRDDFTDRERYDNSIKTMEGMLASKILPVINENDVVSMEDLTVGDNDLLAAMVAIALESDRLILLTNQSGLHTANPETDESAELILKVESMNKEFEKMFSGKPSLMGRGGILSKVRAARHAVYAGIETYIADGRQKGILRKLIERRKGGTHFPARKVSDITAHQRWLMSAKGFGEVVVDDGAVRALQNGKSLLFPGIFEIKGLFEKGQIVEVISRKGLPVAYGKVNYGHRDIQNTLALRKSGKKSALAKELIHRDHMVVLNI